MRTSLYKNSGTREHAANSGRHSNFLNFIDFDRAQRFQTERRSTQECRAPRAKRCLLVFISPCLGSSENAVQDLKQLKEGLAGFVKSRPYLQLASPGQ